MISYLANQVEVEELIASEGDDIIAHMNLMCAKTALAAVQAGAIIMKNGGSTSSELMRNAFNSHNGSH